MRTTELKLSFSNLEYFQDKLPWVRYILSSRLVYHLSFWLILFLFNTVSLGYDNGTIYEYIICYLYRLPFVIIACYFNLYFLLPRYYYKDRIFTYLCLLGSFILLMNALNMLLLDELLINGRLAKSMGEKEYFTLTHIGYYSFYMVSVVGFTLGGKLSKDHYFQKQKADMMEKDRLATELSMLKSQMQPHFFFNTLNNLYALTLKKSDLAPEVVLKLSELMSYLLYDTDQEMTSLPQEINYIKNYIDLESLRFEQPPEVTFEITGNCDHVYLPPVLLLPFIENSFKHSVRSPVRPIKIDIQLSVEPGKLLLKVANPFAEPVQNAKGGIGLKNVKRRLDLIYNRNYRLSQNRCNHIFKTELQIPLP